MSIARFQIGKVFDDLEHLLFDCGIYLSPSPLDGMWVQFWSATLRVRRIVSHQNGKLHGLQGIYNQSGQPAMIEHFRSGYRYGEVLCFPSTARTQSHLLYRGNGEHSIPYTSKAAEDFQGFLFTKEERELPGDLYQVFARRLNS